MVRYLSCVRRSKPTLSRHHCKCLKTAPSKIKHVDNYSCPICDSRVKILRDAARPKLENLQDWAEEIYDTDLDLKRSQNCGLVESDFVVAWVNDNGGCRRLPEVSARHLVHVRIH
jgi:hypothetical protein